ncbi:TonB-dependent receptor [Asticcacaulis solisilvae]|uniref:TonB-dependent receptor n=1 Tax=Asticcacaulis solisilvae TaxID=1217274 RepID=UPI003FD7F9DF
MFNSTFKTTLLASCALGAVSFAAPHTVLAQDTQNAQPADTSSVVVFGHRAATRRSIEQKKTAAVQVEVATANDAGKLPDQNVAETVRRLTGVTAANDQGEGRYVIIRGLDPNLAAVRVNGQSAAAPEPEGRQVKLDDIPTGLIGQVTVVKNQTADYDANAIAGAVDIKTLSALDRKGPFFNGRFAEGRFDLNKKSPSEADMTFGTRFGANHDMGFVISVNNSRRPMRSNNLQGSSNWTTGTNGFTTPDDWRPRDYNLTRDRAGAAAAFDWKPDADTHLFARVLSSRFSDDETRDQFRVPIPTTGLTNQTATSGDFSGVTATRFVRRRQEVDRVLTESLGGEFKLGEGKLSLAATASRSSKDDPLRSEWQFTASGISGHYDDTGVVFLVTPSAKAYDATQFKAKSFNLDVRHAQEDLHQLTADYEVPTGLFGDATLKFGAKYSERHKTNERDYKAYKLSTAFTLASTGTLDSSDSVYNGTIPFGPRVNYDLATAYAINKGYLVLDTAGSVANSLGVDYDVSEKIGAAYAMLTVKTGKWTLIPGLRVEDTDSGYKAKSFTPASSVTQDFNVFGGKHYTDLFPSLVTRYDISESQVMRLSATTAIGRPNYSDLAPYVNDDGAGNVTYGNPNLKPWRSVNLDAAFEQYVGKDGLLTVAVFRKDLDTPIFTVGTNASNMPKNAASGYVNGVELAAVYTFDWLPGPLSGFGVNLNATLQDAKAKGAPGRAGEVPLYFTSKTSGTAELTYEKYGIMGRIAYTYRSHYLDTLGVDAAHDLYTGDNGQLDAKLSYALSQNWLVYVEGTNLNNAPWRRWEGNNHQLVENEIYGKTVKVGISSKF